MSATHTCQVRSRIHRATHQFDRRPPHLQILTIKELLAGKKIDMPQTRGINVTFKQAPKAKVEVGSAQASLLDDLA